MANPKNQHPTNGKAKDDSKAKAEKPKAAAGAPTPPAPPAPEAPKSSDPAKVGEKVKELGQKVTGPTSVLLSVTLLKAALSCASKGDERTWLGGVFIHRDGDKARIVGSDGHRLFVAQSEIEAADGEPDWLAKGIIIPADGLAPRLALIEKEAGKGEIAFAKITYAPGAPRVKLQDEDGRCIFRMTPLDGAYPDYNRIIADEKFARALSGEFDREAAVGVGFQGKYLKHVGDLAKLLGKTTDARGKADTDDAVQVFAGGESDPAICTFRGCPGAVLVVMPQANIGVLNAGAAQILSPAVTMTVGALKAHETRNREWAAKAEGIEREQFTAKADAFKQRWQTLMSHLTPALPAPKPTTAGEAKVTPKAPKPKADLPKGMKVAKDGKIETPAKPPASSKPSPSAKAVPPGPKAPAQRAEHKGEGRGKAKDRKRA